MKFKTVLISCTLIVGLVCCHKEFPKNYKSNGKILGFDLRMCACCGGWYIVIDTSTYEFDSIPKNSNINLQEESFPLFVKLDWQLSDKISCPYDRITIQRIVKE